VLLIVAGVFLLDSLRGFNPALSSFRKKVGNRKYKHLKATS
jgi:hypothetical protein